MDMWLILTVVGFVLVIVELVTGTFYLIVIAAGVFLAAVLAYFGANALVQAVAGSAVALLGAWYVHHWHGAKSLPDAGQANFLDKGQPVVLESWVDEASGLARVKYRGASWDARVAGTAPRPAPGAMLYIDGQEGNTLLVGATPPAR
jgi:membrane protein implicated in regulation of membrane protease activity